MTVQELIDKLSEMPRKATLAARDGTGAIWYDIHVGPIKVWRDRFGFLHDRDWECRECGEAAVEFVIVESN
jgi:hypothetical protein